MLIPLHALTASACERAVQVFEGHRLLPIPIPHLKGYLVSDCGVIASDIFRTGKPGVRNGGCISIIDPSKRKILTKSIHKYKGYQIMGYRKKQYKVHRLVLLAWVGPPPVPGMLTRHLNGDKTDNRLENLCWGTSQENSDDSLRLGELPLGENQHCHKLTNEQVLDIRRRDALGETRYSIAKKFKVSHPNVTAICRRETWKHI